MTRLELLFVGFGHVAQRFATLLDDERRILAREYGLATRIAGIATGRHGSITAPEGRGLDVAPIVDRLARGRPIGGQLGRERSIGEQPVWRKPIVRGASAAVRASAAPFIRRLARGSAAGRDGRLVVIETTTLDIRQGQPAIDHVLAALAARAHVITANKGPVAFAYRRLAAAARRADRRFLFEGAVMDGVPVFNLVRCTLPAVEITGFRGVVNSTTNYILTAMEEGRAFDTALAEMQAAGVAEADASLDLDGWDAAAKTAALANVLLGANLTPRLVERDGISAATGSRAAAARAAGRRLKLVVAAARAPDRVDARDRVGGRGRVRARVSLEELAGDDLLAGLAGQQNAIAFQTDLLGEIGVVQRGAGLTQTAYALLADLIEIGCRVLRATC